MADSLTEEQIAEFREAFSTFDEGDGSISATVLGSVMRTLGRNPTNAELGDMMDDVESHGSIDFDSFLNMMCRTMEDAADEGENEYAVVFEHCKKDQWGVPTIDAVKLVMQNLGENMTNEELKEFMKEEEFVKAFPNAK